MKYAPIVLFAFNRLEPLKSTIESLLENPESSESELFIFVDGIRKENQTDIESVKSVQEYVKGISGFKKVEYFFSKKNNGLGISIINGINQIIKLYGLVIVLEDDLFLSSNFLSFMNAGLEKYRSNPEVFSICGYSNKIRKPQNYNYDAYFCTRSSSWGWGTWIDRWNSIDWELKDWESIKRQKKSFNNWGGSDCFSMLQNWKDGKNSSWAIRFCYSQFTQRKISLFPIISKVKNNGFDGSGTNCKKWNRFKIEFDTSQQKTFNFPHETNINKEIKKSALSYHSIIIRCWSKFRYLFS